MNIQSYLQAFFESYKISFSVSYSDLKWECERLGYNISNFNHDVRQTLTAMFCNDQIQYFEVNHNGLITVDM